MNGFLYFQVNHRFLNLKTFTNSIYFAIFIYIFFTLPVHHLQSIRLNLPARKNNFKTCDINNRSLNIILPFFSIFIGFQNLVDNKIIYEEIGHINDYDENLNPAITNEHAHAAYRFFHTHIVGQLKSVYYKI